MNKEDWDFWYYDRVNQFSQKLISSFEKNQFTINDYVKNEQENKGE
jgi:hypothetical protein